MKIERTKNAFRNAKFGLILKIYQIVAPFALRTAIIYKLGVQYVGLSSLFTSILSVLSLAELGVGAAMVFSMYKPIAEDDTETICALMKLYKTYYRIIGFVILIISLIIVPFLPKLISGTIPDGVNLYIIYAISVTSTVLSYWLFAYKSCLFTAHQRGDISSKISLLICTLTYILQFISLFLFESYYIYLFSGVITQIIQNIISSKVVDRIYPNYKAKGKIPKKIKNQINQKVRDLFTAKLGGIVYNSVDTIVISAFLGITVLGIYNNYFYIMSSIIGFLDIIYYSCLAGIGNSIITESKQKNFDDFEKFSFLIANLSAICTCCFLNLYQPFMMIWMNNKSDMLLDYKIIICLCIYFFLGQLNKIVNTYKDAAGIWHEDRFRPLLTAIVNLTFNIILVKYIGLFGIILSTIIATAFIDFPWVTLKIFNSVFNKKQLKKFILKITIYILSTILISITSYYICSFINIDGILGLLLKLCICILVSTTIITISYHKTAEFKFLKNLIFNSLKTGMRIK